MFAKNVIGIITKIDIANKDEIELAKEKLKMAGVNEIFLVDTIKGIGIEELFEYLS